jgi:hypothetical protein
MCCHAQLKEKFNQIGLGGSFAKHIWARKIFYILQTCSIDDFAIWE